MTFDHWPIYRSDLSKVLLLPTVVLCVNYAGDVMACLQWFSYTGIYSFQQVQRTLTFGSSFRPLTIDMIDALCHRTCVLQLAVCKKGVKIAGEECFPALHGREVDSKVSEETSSFHTFSSPSPLSLSLSQIYISSPKVPFLIYFLFPFPSIFSISLYFPRSLCSLYN